MSILTQCEYKELIKTVPNNIIKFELTSDGLFRVFHKDFLLDPSKKWVLNAAPKKDKLIAELLYDLSNGIVPLNWRIIDSINARSSDHTLDINQLMLEAQLKDLVNRKYNMYGLVDRTWVNGLVDRLQSLFNMSCPKVLEIGAGSGWLSKAISDCGLKVISTDPLRYLYYDLDKTKPMVFNVEELGHIRSIDKYIEDIDVLVCSWPPYINNKTWDGMLTESIKHLKAIGNKDIPIVYIGEGEGGCTDSISLWKHIEVIERIYIPHWEFIHDCCHILKIV